MSLRRPGHISREFSVSNTRIQLTRWLRLSAALATAAAVGLAIPNIAQAAAQAAVSAAPVATTGTAATSPALTRFSLGTLGTHAETAAKESAGGVKVAMIEFSWAQDEPQAGVFNPRYEAAMVTRLAALHAAGMRVTLAMGLHFTPDWVLALPGARFVDQHGNVSNEVDLVFNQQMRDLALGYLAHLNSIVPVSQFWAIRITGGGDAEALFPGTGAYWAFNPSAQNGPNMPANMAPNPFPGWHPGTAGLSSAQVQTWADWYEQALVNEVTWQMSVVFGGGFTGYFQVLTPGLGATPQFYNAVVAANLPDSIVGVGAVWDRFYQALPYKKNVVAYISSVADGSGSNSGCQRTDDQVPLTSIATANWSATRWISRIADAYGLAKAGENPGYLASPQFQASYRDLTTGGMESVSTAQAQSCRFQTLYWAHDDQLWDGMLTLSSLLSKTQPLMALPAVAS